MLHSWSATLRKGALSNTYLWMRTMRSVGQVPAYFVAILEVTQNQRQYPPSFALARINTSKAISEWWLPKGSRAGDTGDHPT